MVKFKHLLWGAGLLGTGYVVLRSGKTRASVGPQPPKNLATIEGKLDALQALGAIALGGDYILVSSDPAHWSLVSGVATQRARANPGVEYRLVPLALARELAGDRGYTFPVDAWGGAASVRSAELVDSQYFSGSEGATEVDTLVQTVEKAL